MAKIQRVNNGYTFGSISGAIRYIKSCDISSANMHVLVAKMDGRYAVSDATTSGYAWGTLDVISVACSHTRQELREILEDI